MEDNDFERRIRYRFSDRALLYGALTHSSASDGKNHQFDRMEYLGDAVLELVISHFLYDTFPLFTEGELTKVRTGIVTEHSLYRAAKSVGLDRQIRLGRGEENTGGREKPSILSDAVEALIGAIYLDGGLEAAQSFVLRILHDAIRESVRQGGVLDYKTRLQELLQKDSPLPICYETQRQPGETVMFRSRVCYDGLVLGEGCGSRKKSAEQQAAKQALDRLEHKRSGR
ncbi:MAG: ribonuclease III [Christensenellales bacterium]